MENAQVVAAEGACADDRDANGAGHGLLDGGFDGLTAASVEVQELGDGVFALGGGGCGETGGRVAGAGLDVGVRGEEFEQIERDVFRAAGGGGGGAGVHVGLSLSPLMVAGWGAGVQCAGVGRSDPTLAHKKLWAKVEHPVRGRFPSGMTNREWEGGCEFGVGDGGWLAYC